MIDGRGFWLCRTALCRLAAVPVAGIVIGLVVGLACGSTTKAVGTAAAVDVVACTTTDVTKWSAQLGPALEQALLRAMGGDGKVDLPSLQQIGGALEADGWCVLEKTVAQLIAAAAPKTASAAAPLDAADLKAKLAALRAAKFGTTTFQLASPPQ